ncbi:BSD domain-containing protein 1-like isoform X2 [Glandiceps talaboti]
MAEGGEDGNWWGGWMKAAKDKSSEAWGFMKKDLAEFSSVVQKDTSVAVAQTADSVKSQLKARLHDIQIDPGTYLNEPNGPLEEYVAWKETYLVDEHKGDISDLLVASDEVRSIYTKLVPSAASHADFWHRYFYKVHQLDQDEARRAALKERAEISSKTFTEEDLGWGDEDDTWEVTEIPEDMSTDRLKPDSSQLTPDQKESDKNITSKDSETIEPTIPDDQTEKLKSKDLDKDKETIKITDDANTSNDKSPDASRTTEEAIPSTVETQEQNELDKTEIAKDVTGDSEQGKASNEEHALESVTSEGSSIEELRYSDDNKGKDEDKQSLQLPLTKEDLKKDGSGKSSPVHSDNGTGTKDTSSLSDDWERDFDIEITEQDLKHAAALSASGKDKEKEEDLDDDWENWE